jgi:hypothetical protein
LSDASTGGRYALLFDDLPFEKAAGGRKNPFWLLPRP